MTISEKKVENFDSKIFRLKDSKIELKLYFEHKFVMLSSFFVPDLVTGVWTGADNRSVRFRDLHLGQGAEMALPIWGEYMQQLYKNSNLNISDQDFPFPEGGVSVTLDCEEKTQFNNDEF